jgi:hypothetical protein
MAFYLPNLRRCQRSSYGIGIPKKGFSWREQSIIRVRSAIIASSGCLTPQALDLLRCGSPRPVAGGVPPFHWMCSVAFFMPRSVYRGSVSKGCIRHAKPAGRYVAYQLDGTTTIRNYDNEGGTSDGRRQPSQSSMPLGFPGRTRRTFRFRLLASGSLALRPYQSRADGAPLSLTFLTFLTMLAFVGR